MKKFKITASYTHYCTAEIDAENLQQAEEQARDMDGGSFTPSHTDDWKIERVDEVPHALTEEQAAFIEAYGTSVADATAAQIVEFFHMDDDAFIEKFSTGTYSSIMDARMVWLNALNFADRKAAQ